MKPRLDCFIFLLPADDSAHPAGASELEEKSCEEDRVREWTPQRRRERGEKAGAARSEFESGMLNMMKEDDSNYNKI